MLVRDCNSDPHCMEVSGWLIVVYVNWVAEGVVAFLGDSSSIGSLLRWFVLGCLRKLGERMAFMNV